MENVTLVVLKRYCKRSTYYSHEQRVATIKISCCLNRSFKVSLYFCNSLILGTLAMVFLFSDSRSTEKTMLLSWYVFFVLGQIHEPMIGSLVVFIPPANSKISVYVCQIRSFGSSCPATSPSSGLKF